MGAEQYIKSSWNFGVSGSSMTFGHSDWFIVFMLLIFSIEKPVINCRGFWSVGSLNFVCRWYSAYLLAYYWISPESYCLGLLGCLLTLYVKIIFPLLLEFLMSPNDNYPPLTAARFGLLLTAFPRIEFLINLDSFWEKRSLAVSRKSLLFNFLARTLT
jgi:hypothetical protein